MGAHPNKRVKHQPREGVDLDARPTEAAFRSLLVVCGLLRRAMQPYFARFGISGSQWGVLRVLDRAEADGEARPGGFRGLRLSEVSDRLLIRPPSVTGVVDRLERQGLVVRTTPDGGDHRVKHLSLTPAGRELVRRVLENHAAQIKSVMAALSIDEQRSLGQLLERLGGHLDAIVDREEGSLNAQKGLEE